VIQPNAPVEIYQLHILLLHIKPPIRRRLHVRRDSSMVISCRNRPFQRAGKGEGGLKRGTKKNQWNRKSE
jgi:hypothetical protein